MDDGMERGFRPQLHYFVMLLVWGLLAGWALLYLAFVSNNVWDPARFWWFASSASIGTAVLVACCLVVQRMLRRTHVTWAIAIFMLTVTPLIWLASWSWFLVDSMNQRQDIRLNAPTMALGLWFSGYLECEARWRYPRQTSGEHVILFDDGTLSNVDELVNAMDEHIRAMAKHLNSEPPETKVRWVRGSLFGQQGRALGIWGICDTNDESGELQYLDRHEVAHVLITLLSPVRQGMPMLLAEGWAQTQSTERARAILYLLQSKKNGESLSLMELTSAALYGRSVGTVYVHGGPVVWYLLERFGGTTFLELYSNVKRDSFDKDAADILGIEWKQLNSDFWQWLENQRAECQSEIREAGLGQDVFYFNTEETQGLWQQIVRSLQRDRQTSLPESFALEATVNDAETPYVVQIVVEDDTAWTVQSFPGKERPDEFNLISPDQRWFIQQMPDGSLVADADFEDQPISVESELAGLRQFWFQRQSLDNAFFFDVDEIALEESRIRHRIESIEPGRNLTDPWKIRFRTEFDDDSEQTEESVLQVDPDNHFDVLNNETRSTGVTRSESFVSRQMFGHRMAAEASTRINGQTTSTTTVRQLNPDQVAAVKQAVQSRLAQVSTNPSVRARQDWNALLATPLTLAIVWPALALLVLGIDMIGDRVKIRIPNQSTNPEKGDSHE